MTRDWENTFNHWAASPSNHEQTRCENAIRTIRKAVSNSSKLKNRRILVFTQGSFRNRVNVRQDSDVDVGVMLHQFFLPQYPEGKSQADFGHLAVEYTYAQFKNELEDALVAHFGRNAVQRGNKAFDITENSYRVEADVVPLFEFRRYWESGNYRAGVALIPDNSPNRNENYPERLVNHWPKTPLHYENGVSKNTATGKHFKGIVRILKQLRNELENYGEKRAEQVPGYLLECLVWNTPNHCFNSTTWVDRVQSVLSFLWQNTRELTLCSAWCEVDNIKYLFHDSQPWTSLQAHAFMMRRGITWE